MLLTNCAVTLCESEVHRVQGSYDVTNPNATLVAMMFENSYNRIKGISVFGKIFNLTADCTNLHCLWKCLLH